MEILFDKYIDNPSGGSSVVTNRSMYKKMYSDKFNAVLLREQGNIKYTLYKAEDKYDSHYIHFKIPSEKLPNFYYDVVIQFYTGDNSVKSDGTLRKYFVKFYSNDPAFVYTFAHSFIVNNLFITDLKSKMAKDAIRKAAKEKNPKNDVWYVKSLYFAYLAIEKYGLFSKAPFRVNAEKYNKDTLTSNIEQAELKVSRRQEEGQKFDEEQRRKAKRDGKEQPERNKAIQTKKSGIVKTSAVSKITKSPKKIKTSKKSSTISMRNKSNNN